MILEENWRLVKIPICLTESSAMLWKMLAQGTTEQAMWQAMLDTYEVDEAPARKDTAEFLENMKAPELFIRRIL